jgi:cell division protein FtsQ
VWQLQRIEEKIAAHPFTQSVEAYADHKGNLSIQVAQKRPIARLISQKGNDRYLTAEGELLPLSEKHSARVPLLIGKKLENLLLNEASLEDKAGLMALLHYLDKDEFWKAQITEIEWKDQAGIVLYPQVGKQFLELGYPEDLERKFEKLMMFYTRIAPLQGWNKYSRVNVSFDNQIVCE